VAASAAFVVAIAVLLACFAAYRGSRDALIGSADASLAGAYTHIYSGTPPSVDPNVAPGFGMLLYTSGKAFISYNMGTLPTDAAIKQVASGQGHALFRTILTSDGRALRELIAPIPAGTILEQVTPDGHEENIGLFPSPAALVLVESFQGVEERLRSLGVDLALLAALGVLVAALFGWLAARAALIPLAQTTRDIEEIATTLDVSHRVDEGSNDELGRLRRAFNQLLEELELSQDSQRQLILDASHELRTPLTSLRANAQVLGRIDELGKEDVTQLSDDMVTQVDELTRLVGDLTELTRGEHSVEEAQDLDLDELVGECAEIAETHARTKHISIELTSAPSTVRVKRDRLTRAVGNLLDNAIKFSPEGSSVAVTCKDGAVIVDDSGPGIDDADLPYVFDRFYRSSRDRGQPGSGLGLAIVAQVVQEAGGTIEAARSETLGGARMVLRLPMPDGRTRF
jgi:two-component system sensor histidine kinase MprB